MCNSLLCRNQSQSTVFYQSGRNHACSMHPEHNLALQRAPIDHVPRARMPIESGLSPIRVRIERNTSMIRAQCHDVSPVGITTMITGPCERYDKRSERAMQFGSGSSICYALRYVVSYFRLPQLAPFRFGCHAPFTLRINKISVSYTHLTLPTTPYV